MTNIAQVHDWEIQGLPDPKLEPAPPVSRSEIGFRLNVLEIAAKDISGNPYEKIYPEIEAMRRAELAAEQQSQARIDALAESVPRDLAQYPLREI